MSAPFDFAILSPYELGLTDSREAIPYLIEYLRKGQSNDRRLAASAIIKLCKRYRSDCQAAIPALLTCLEDLGAQARQYALKALNAFELPTEALAPIRAIYSNDEKEYNQKIACAILHKYGNTSITTTPNSHSPNVAGSVDTLQSRVEGCLDDIDALGEDLQEHLNWIWNAEEKVTALRIDLQHAEHQLIAKGIEGKNQLERQANLATILASKRQTLEDAERQLRLARHARDENNAILTLIQHRLHALELLVSLRRSQDG